jgi:hypothetical protein
MIHETGTRKIRSTVRYLRRRVGALGWPSRRTTVHRCCWWLAHRIRDGFDGANSIISFGDRFCCQIIAIGLTRAISASIEADIAQRIRLYGNAAGSEGPIVNHEKHETTCYRG